MPTRAQLLSQLHSLRHTGLYKLLETAAAQQALPLAYLLGIASRETNGHNELGDYQGGEYHGVGPMQIDIQHWLARAARDDGSWKGDPGPLIEFGAILLRQNYAAARVAFPDAGEPAWLKIAASGYNAGIETAIHAARHGDSDSPTTGHDYGRDTVQRMSIFEELLGGNQ